MKTYHLEQVSKQHVEKGWGVPARVLPRPFAHCPVLSAASLLSLSWTRLVTQLLVAVALLFILFVQSYINRQKFPF